MHTTNQSNNRMPSPWASRLDTAEQIQRSDPKKSHEIAYEVMKEISIDRSPELWIRALYIKTRSAWFMGRFEEALLGANELLHTATAHHSHTYIAHAHNLIGNVNLHLDNLDKALEMYRDGMKPAEASGDLSVQSALLNNIGEIYNRLKAYDQAKMYYEKSLDLAKETDIWEAIGICYLNLAEIALFQGDYFRAQELLDQSQKTFVAHNDRLGEAGTSQLMGDLKLEQDEPEKAIELFMKAIHLSDLTEDRYNRILAGLDLIKAYIQLNRLDVAEREALHVLKIAEDIQANGQIASAASVLANIYELTGDYQKALTYYKKYHDMDLQSQKESLEEKLNHVRVQFKIEQTQTEKELYRIKNVELREKHAELKKLYEDISTISKIGQEITATLDLQIVLNRIHKHIQHMMDASFFGIALYKHEQDVLDYALFISEGEELEKTSTSSRDENSITAWVIRNRQEVFIQDYLHEHQKYKQDYTANRTGKISQSIMCVPLMVEEEIVGVLTVQSYERNAYTEHHLDALKALGSYIAIAIRNSRESQLLEQEIKERKSAQEHLQELNQRLSELTYIDALTKIPNRRRFIDFLSHELHRSIREAEPLTVMIVDVDKFKEYNDNYGHLAGDVALSTVAGLLEKGLRRQVDFVARYGGDEFVVVLPNTDEDGGRRVAATLRKRIEEAQIEHSYSSVAPIVSITLGGYSIVPTKEITVERIVHLADQALYVAKAQGRNTFVFNECVIADPSC